MSGPFPRAKRCWKILTRPVIFTEKTEKLGDLGDILLADLSQYVVGLRSEMRSIRRSTFISTPMNS